MAEAQVRPLSPLRKVIAARMSEAVRTIPHFRVAADFNAETFLLARREHNAHSPHPVSINDCVVKACALALCREPELNCQFVDGAVHSRTDVDISMVVAIPGGLSTPVIRRADRKSLVDLSKEARALTERAQAGTLRMDEIVDGTFSVSNLGGAGVEMFDAIINPPQCAILAVGAARKAVIPGNDDQPRIATMMYVSLSLDHRVVDGMAGAALLKALRQVLEAPSEVFAP